MKKSIKLIAAVCLLCVTVLFAGCSKEKKIVGTWKAVSASSVINGFSISLPQDQLARYSMTFNEDGTAEFAGTTASYAVDGDELSLTYSNETITLKIEKLTNSKMELSMNEEEVDADLGNISIETHISLEKQ